MWEWNKEESKVIFPFWVKGKMVSTEIGNRPGSGPSSSYVTSGALEKMTLLLFYRTSEDRTL